MAVSDPAATQPVASVTDGASGYAVGRVQMQRECRTLGQPYANDATSKRSSPANCTPAPFTVPSSLNMFTFETPITKMVRKWTIRSLDTVKMSQAAQGSPDFAMLTRETARSSNVTARV